MKIINVFLVVSLGWTACYLIIGYYFEQWSFTGSLLNTFQTNFESPPVTFSSISDVPFQANLERDLKSKRHPRPTFPDTSTVYFSVKTTPQYYKSRLDVLRATWFQVVQRDKLSIVSDYVNDSFHDEKIFEKEFIKGGFNLVLAHCRIVHGRFGLCCKSGTEYKLFFDYLNRTQGQNQIKWFCHFDDDIYVNVKELLKLLSQYDSSKPYYIGRNPRGPLGAGLDIHRQNRVRRYFHGNAKPHFMYAAGAAYCISMPLMKELHKYFRDPEVFQDSCDKVTMSDDLTLGVVIDLVLNYRLTSINKMYIESTDLDYLKKLSEPDLVKMITISYRTSKQDQNIIFNIIDPKPSKFTPLQDPTRFLAYHCLLYNATSWCQSDDESPLISMNNPVDDLQSLSTRVTTDHVRLRRLNEVPSSSQVHSIQDHSHTAPTIYSQRSRTINNLKAPYDNDHMQRSNQSPSQRSQVTKSNKGYSDSTLSNSHTHSQSTNTEPSNSR